MNRINQNPDHLPTFLLLKPTILPNLLIEVTAFHELQNQIPMLPVLKLVDQLNNPRVVELPLDGDLTLNIF